MLTVLTASSFCINAVENDEAQSLPITIFSADPNHNLPHPQNNDTKLFKTETDGIKSVQVADFAIDQLSNVKVYNFILPNGQSYDIVPTNKNIYSDDILSVSGYIQEFGEQSDYSSVFTYSQDGLIGDFFLPEGHYKVDTNKGLSLIYTPAYFNQLNDSDVFEHDQGDHNDFPDWLDQDIIEMASQSKMGFINNTARKTYLNVAAVISQSAGNFNTAKNNVIQRVSLANHQFNISHVNIQLTLKFITSVKSQYDIGLSNSVINASADFSALQTNMIDLDSQNFESFPASLSQVNIHQFVLVVGSNTGDNTCGSTTTAPNGFGKFSAIRIGSIFGNICPANTFLHEIAHNLTLTHSDGACKSNIVNDSLCQFIPTEPGSPVGVKWRSIMQSQARTANYFTGGANDSIIDYGTCLGLDGVCNMPPLADHNSIGKLNSARLLAANNYTAMNVAPSPFSPDSYDDVATRGYTDAYEGDAVAWPGVNGYHFRDFNDAGDDDWTMV